jgi:hypothetical protein
MWLLFFEASQASWSKLETVTIIGKYIYLFLKLLISGKYADKESLKNSSKPHQVFCKDQVCQIAPVPSGAVYLPDEHHHNYLITKANQTSHLGVRFKYPCHPTAHYFVFFPTQIKAPHGIDMPWGAYIHYCMYLKNMHWDLYLWMFECLSEEKPSLVKMCWMFCVNCVTKLDKTRPLKWN